MKMTYLVGIDEVGRGPVAGPVAVGIAAFPRGFDLHELSDVRDSKKHTVRQREVIYTYLCEKRKAGELDFSVVFTTAAYIDRHGIVPAIQKALRNALKKLSLSGRNAELLLDGGLSAPEVFKKQQTIVRGDSTERVISFAAIAAKVERDRLMEKMAKKYPEYGFERHKGYGTHVHMEAIKRHGFSPLHRKSFLSHLAD